MLFVFIFQVYRNFQYRKQTKLQFARDDPAFLVLMAGCLVFSTLGFALVLDMAFAKYVKLVFYVLFIDCITTGVIIATLLWGCANLFLLKSPHNLENNVEWAFAFDVHLNAFFPLIVILHFINLLCYDIFMNTPYFFSTFIGNSLWLIAVFYYI